jgi:hypothetical protein
MLVTAEYFDEFDTVQIEVILGGRKPKAMTHKVIGKGPTVLRRSGRRVVSVDTLMTTKPTRASRAAFASDWAEIRAVMNPKDRAKLHTQIVNVVAALRGIERQLRDAEGESA